MKKRTIWIMVAVFCCATLIMGCGDSKKKEEPQATPKPTPSPKIKKVDEVKKEKKEKEVKQAKKVEEIQADKKKRKGLTTIFRPIKGVGNIAMTILFSIGGDHDPGDRSGMAHFVEHLYVTAATSREKARTANEFFQHYGSQCNAQTGDRYTK